MILVLSPAKTLDYTRPIRTRAFTQPRALDESAELVRQMRKLKASQLTELMDISMPLAQLNEARFAQWSLPFDTANARQAVFAFDGDVYEGLQAASLTSADLQWAQKRLRILSGLYGILRPLDLMQPYRLEMGTSLSIRKHRSLYQFWGTRIATTLAEDAKDIKAGVIVNLASEEYFQAVDLDALSLPVIQPVFQDGKPGKDGTEQFKVISFFAKRARGMMARFAIEHRLKKPDQLKAFDLAGYRFNPQASDAQRWVFQRSAPAAT